MQANGVATKRLTHSSVLCWRCSVQYVQRVGDLKTTIASEKHGLAYRYHQTLNDNTWGKRVCPHF